MSWLKLDDGFVENTKIMDLSDRAFRLHVAGLCYCARNLTDGLLVDRATKVVCVVVGAQRRHVSELRDAGLWVPLEDGWAIKDYLDYNPDAATVKDERRKARERMRKLRGSGERSPERADEPAANVRGEFAGTFGDPVPSRSKDLLGVSSDVEVDEANTQKVRSIIEGELGSAAA